MSPCRLGACRVGKWLPGLYLWKWHFNKTETLKASDAASPLASGLSMRMCGGRPYGFCWASEKLMGGRLIHQMAGEAKEAAINTVKSSKYLEQKICLWYPKCPPITLLALEFFSRSKNGHSQILETTTKYNIPVEESVIKEMWLSACVMWAVICTSADSTDMMSAVAAVAAAEMTKLLRVWLSVGGKRVNRECCYLKWDCDISRTQHTRSKSNTGFRGRSGRSVLDPLEER